MNKIIKACKNRDRTAQRKLYEMFYSYALNICVHYARDVDEGKDMVHEGFYNIFRRIENYKEDVPFKLWLRRVMINASIDYHRKYHKMVVSIEKVQTVSVNSVDVLNDLEYDDLLGLIQKLTPRYRMVFNLYILEGYKHLEIAELLDISIGTSKSNLARAKIKPIEMMDIKDIRKQK